MRADLSDAERELERKASELRDALRELLQYDRSDLDFGMYRVLNQRRDDIDSFLDDQLVTTVRSSIEGAVEDPDDRANIASKVCADLRRFFERYYDDGDFIPLPRYRAGTYSVPYEGEEVLLHWANRDQYYIKSAEQLSSYSFSLEGGRRVSFHVVSTDEDAEGNKPSPDEERRYTLADPAFIVEDDELAVRWSFVAKKKGVTQKNLNEDAVSELLEADDLAGWVEALSSDREDGRDGSLLESHVSAFTTRSTSDYFVHRDLGAFLNRELQDFLQSRLLGLEEIGSADVYSMALSLARLKAGRSAARPVIDFLAQVEDFQKRVWLKKKLVLDSSWLVTLDLVPDDLLGEIAESDEQRQAWKRDLAVEEIPGWQDPPPVEFLQQNRSLVLDTSNFDADFTRRLLATFEDIDEMVIGTAIDGDCFQALRLLERRYRGSVNASYIDPPYNTGGGDFLYKDRYQHSSWLSMISDRLELGRELLAADGVQVSSIDDDEQPRLRLAFDDVYGPANFVASVAWQKKYSPQSDAKWFSDDHDYLLFYAKDKNRWYPGRFPRTAATDSAYKNPDNDPRGDWKSGDYTKRANRYERPNGWYAVIRPVDGHEIWPSPDRVWAYVQEEHELNVEDNRVWFGTDGLNSVPSYKRFLTEVGGLVPRTIWSHQDAGHNQDGVRDLQALFGSSPFRSPKPLRLLRRILQVCEGELVLDFFAGSGTTGHAVIEERREGVSKRKFLLAEQGPHFETVLKPRVMKALHSGDWKEGCPESREAVSGMVKILKLETYDDALDSIELVRDERQAALFTASPEFANDYLVRYMLSTEGKSRLTDAQAFARPFSAATVATVDGVKEASPVDLPETFNWLLGLTVKRMAHEIGLLAIRGTGRLGQEILVVWRDVESVSERDLVEWVLGLPEDLLDRTVSEVYVNGDTELERHRPEDSRWIVRLTEETFSELMFEETEAP